MITRFPMTFLRALLMVCLALSAHPALARCAGAVMLGGLHDAYDATLRDTDGTRQRAAMALLVFVGGQDANRLASQVLRDGIDAKPERLAKALEQAESLARAVLSQQTRDIDVFQHGTNINWLASLYLASGCQTSASTTSRSVGETGFFGGATPAQSVSKSFFGKDNGLMAALIFMTGLAVLAYGIHRFMHSFFVRRRLVERLPRVPLSLPLQLTYTDPNGDMKEASGDVIDISQGGLKLSWSDPPPAKTLVTVTLLTTQRLCQVMWSNSYCAGLMFEKQLTNPELKALTEKERALENENGALKGAVSS